MPLLVVLAALLLVLSGGCGNGEAGPADDAGPTTTAAETAPLEEDRAYLLALDFCASAPLGSISLLQGGSPEELARDFADQIRPELREAALAGCLAALEQRG